MELLQMRCRRCGSDKMNTDGDNYVCDYCGTVYKKEKATEYLDEIKSIFGDALASQKEEQIANLRRVLWAAVNEEYTDSIKISTVCRDIKKYLPDDFQANFYEIAAGLNDEKIIEFLSAVDVDENRMYADDVVEFMIKNMRQKTLPAVGNYIERAYKLYDLVKYSHYATKYEAEAEKIDDCIYDTTQPRDVFVAYSSADMPKVLELVDYLEEEGLTCFVASRNLRHGDGAANKYDERLQEAMQNCKVVVLVSSVKSRTKSDARTKELPYVKNKDIESAPPQYKHNYAKMPLEYKKPRVEYLIENYRGVAAEAFMQEFFEGCEYRYNPKQVAEAIWQLYDGLQNAAQPSLDDAPQAPAEQLRPAEQPEDNVPPGSTEALRAMIDALKNQMASADPSGGVNAEALIVRARQFAEIKNFDSAKQYYNRALDAQPANAEAWWGLFLLDYKFAREEELLKSITARNFIAVQDNFNFKNAVKYASGTFKQIIDKFIEHYNALIEEINRKEAEREAQEEALTAFDIENGVLTKYKGRGGNVAIPAEVTSIGYSAFKDCDGLTSLTIPRGVTRIGNFAFYGCTGLTSVQISDSVTSIGDNAFEGCRKLASLNIPNGVTRIGDNAFHDCRSLASLKISGSVISIGYSAFENCYSLTSVTIPSSVEIIGQWAFAYCDRMKTIYCQAETMPKNWSKKWLGGGLGCGASKNPAQVVWGYKDK